MPDCVALAIHTPAGTLVHTGDFKIDQTPLDGQHVDLHRLAELGTAGVLALFGDSTNIDRRGYTGSERDVIEPFEEIFTSAPRKLVVTTFASSIYRMQLLVDLAERFTRSVRQRCRRSSAAQRRSCGATRPAACGVCQLLLVLTLETTGRPAPRFRGSSTSSPREDRSDARSCSRQPIGNEGHRSRREPSGATGCRHHLRESSVHVSDMAARRSSADAVARSARWPVPVHRCRQLSPRGLRTGDRSLEPRIAVIRQKWRPPALRPRGGRVADKVPAAVF